MPELPPDPDALEKWRNMPQNKPSNQSLPPATGGMGMSRWLIGFLLLMAVLMVIGFLLQSIPN
jgi:hypothetical protein